MNSLHNQAESLFKSGKFSEADKCLDEILAKDPKYMEAYRSKFRLYFKLGQYEDMIRWCDKANEVDPKYIYAFNSRGNALRELKQYEKAVENFNQAIAIDPKFYMAHANKGKTLYDLKRYEESIQCSEKAIDLFPGLSCLSWNLKALALEKLGRKEEALKAFDTSISCDRKSTFSRCNRAKLLNSMGRTDEAMAEFRRCQEILNSGYVDVEMTPGQVEFVTNTVKQLLEVNDLNTKAEEMIKKENQESPLVQKFVTQMKSLQENRNKVTAKIIEKMDDANSADMKNLMNELQNLKNKYENMQKDLTKVQADVKDIKIEMVNIKEELDNKLDNFHKKLDKELAKRDLSPDEREKLKDYFKAFIGTYSAIFITSQVVDSGQVQLDTGSTKADILSTIASFAPFVGNFVSTTIKTVSDFLQSQDMKKNARKMQGLAADSSELSQLIGECAFQIVLNKEKQQQIFQITNEDLQKASGSLFQKIVKICENFEEKIDAYLYTKLHKTPSARLGHNDANDLIGEWINDKIDPFNAKEQIIKKAIATATPTRNDCVGGNISVSSPTINKQVSNAPSPSKQRTFCCNLF